jgi:hypothetical protein
MPIPKPRDGESQKDFISRCMGDKTMHKEYPKEMQRAGVCYESWRAPKKKKENKLLPGLMIGIKRTLEQEEISKKPWGKIKNNKLPVGCFLLVEDPEDRSTWKFPYREGAGGVDPETGVYRKPGKINEGGVRLVLKTISDTRSKVPVTIRNKANDLAKRLDIGKFGKKEEAILFFHNFKELKRLRGMSKPIKENKIMKKLKPRNRAGGILIAEAFLSLQQALRKAVQEQGKDMYVADFSPTEVVYSKYENGQETYYKREYEIENGEVVMKGTAVVVDRKVTYEGEKFGATKLGELILMNKSLKDS